jgi:uncharacterized protein
MDWYDSELERAYEDQDFDKARRLLETGADPNQELPLGCLVDRAVFDDGREEWVALFGSYGGAFDRPDESGLTPLHRAASGSDDPALVRLLVGLGVSVSPRSPAGWTPLHFAAAYGYRRVTEALLAAGADPDAITEEGLTARALAVRNHHEDLANRLDDVMGDGAARRSVG